MIDLHPPQPGLLFSSFLYRQDLHQEKDLVHKWESLFGESLHLRPANNPLAQYYSKEMGELAKLNRIFLLTTTLFARDYLLSTKLIAQDWEKEWSQEGKRTVNMDIGFLSLENFLLATTKNYSHRIFLGQSVFADLTYQYQDNEYQPLPWTYPDYNDKEKKEFFKWGRSFLSQKLAL
jgi:hypothetical protein